MMISLYCCIFVIFFFKQKTAYEMRISDWSSDVCSSDLMELPNLLKSEPSTDAIELLKEDHREVEGLFKEFEDTDDKVEKVALASVICHALADQAEIEEQLFYPESHLGRDEVQEEMDDEAARSQERRDGK